MPTAERDVEKLGPGCHWAEASYQISLQTLPTDFRPVAAIEIPETMPYRRLYFGFALSVPTSGVTWALPWRITVKRSNDLSSAFVMQGRRFTANAATGVTPLQSNGLPSFSVQWFPETGQEWGYDGQSPADAVQWFTDDEDSDRQCIVAATPFRLTGRFSRVELSFFETPSSNAAGTERVTAWIGCYSQTVPGTA
jgi:hypothetical protein